jgi:hypothetical protein
MDKNADNMLGMISQARNEGLSSVSDKEISSAPYNGFTSFFNDNHDRQNGQFAKLLLDKKLDMDPAGLSSQEKGKLLYPIDVCNNTCASSSVADQKTWEEKVTEIAGLLGEISGRPRQTKLFARKFVA